MTRNVFATLILTLTVWACATPQSAQQAVFQTKSNYEVALQVAVAYRELPSCEKSKPPCSSKAIVGQLQKAQPATRQSLDAAETAVRNPELSQNAVLASVSAAQAALRALTSITDTLKVK